jgi:hypothetical protein
MRSLLLGLLVLVAACSESFLPAWGVTDLRVTGARVEVAGQPERARPDPEDTVEISLLVVDQGAPESEDPDAPTLTPGLLQWSFVPCIPAPTLIGPPICQIPIQPCDGCRGTPPDPALAFPVIRFQVPSQAELDAAEADSVVVQGAICAGGPPAEDAILRFILGETDDLNPCEDPSNEGRFVTVVVPIEPTPEDPNLNPELLSITLDGKSWPPPYDEGVPRDALREGCLADLDGLTAEERAQHPVAGTASADIQLAVTSASLQSYMVGEMTRTEEIQVSWLTDGGELERTFSFITAPATSVLTRWRPFPEAPRDGLLVRLTFVIRDGRGGTDWLEKGLCVLPDDSDETPP